LARSFNSGFREQLGRYALYGEIAAGGMASIHVARLLGPAGFARTVAIKRLHPHLAKDPDFVAMFLEEARLATRVRHPNVIATLDVVAEERELFLVMEYVAGESLSRLVRTIADRKQVIPTSIAVGIVLSALEGLHAAHEATSDSGQPLGLVHRDVSPQNVHVGVDGVPRLLDFGIAKATNRVQETRTDQIKGKIAYMSPEQLANGPIDRRADVYSASVVLWECLAGRRLFLAEDVPSLVYAIIHEAVSPPSAWAPGISKELDAVVMKGLEREATRRWSSANEMALALEAALRPASAREIGRWVENVAHSALDSRKALVRRIECETSSTVPPPAPMDDLPPTPDLSSAMVLRDSIDFGVLPAPKSVPDDERRTLLTAPAAPRTSAPVELRPVHDVAPHAHRRIAMGTVAAFVLLAVGVLAGRKTRGPVAASAPPPPSVTLPSASESAILIGAQRAAPTTRPRASRDECENPTYVDSRGTRRTKPACLPKKP
jgi:serine/threonine-protein kinase